MDGILEGVLLVPTVVLTVLLFGAVIRRLLGVRLGPVRAVLAAALALLVAGPVLQAFLPDPEQADPGTALLFAALALCCASLAAMAVVVIADVVVPEGSLPGPVELWRGWRSRAARAHRYAQILQIAVRHGLGRFLRGRRPAGVESAAARRELARSLRRALDEGGVTFVKLGQQLSTRRDLVPAEFADELAALQDEAAPVPWEEVRAVLLAELGRPVEEVFAAVDPEPLAAASVAQVHAARSFDGADVVLKVQRPGVCAVVERDLDILLTLARTLEARTPWGRSLGLVGLATGFADALREELDFTTERDNLTAMAAALRASPSRGVRVPTPHAALSTGRVLVMERLEGTPLGSAGPALAELGPGRRSAVAGALLATVLDQVLDHGLFHVDLHPGNVLLQADGALGLLDLGSVGRLDSTTRTAFGRLMAALGSTDSLTAGDALLELLDRPPEIDERELERALGVLIVRFTAPGASVGAAAFGALFRLVTAHRLPIPAQVAAVFRTFATLEGTLALIDPGFDLVAEARAAGRGRVAQSLTPQRLRRSAEEELAALLPLLRRLPRRVDRIADAVEHGRLGVNVRLFADARDRRLVTGLVHLTLSALLGAAAGLMAVLFLDMPGGPQVTDSVRLFPVFGYGLLVVAVVLVLRVLVVVFRQDRS
ncbi:AarF/ABC1/UbiB kinase family protein [Geodermatophilus sabuli]|uniref:AarF/ABC1/UbiB kinase family protein n=1 Tax=Geodermatophilus sabuli TaxID=1564158 RepID=A0A7K3VV27_9ACTN|nr:AarF/UbiB family protein [Geodermatophilus sabuli]NEK56491.1 AarF/ABC1/UbiB kinase family protein [Geodermatophilus sabuli]